MNKGDVIKILHCRHNFLIGTHAIVDEVNDWGVQCYVNVAGQGSLYLRLENKDFKPVLRSEEHIPHGRDF